MNAQIILKRRTVFDDGSLVQMVIWQVPEPVPPSEDITGELDNPAEKLIITDPVPPVQDSQTTTVDMPKKNKKRSKE